MKYSLAWSSDMASEGEMSFMTLLQTGERGGRSEEMKKREREGNGGERGRERAH